MYKNSSWKSKFSKILLLTKCSEVTNIFKFFNYEKSKIINIMTKDEYELSKIESNSFDSIIYDIEFDEKLIDYLTKYSYPIFFTNCNITSNIIKICNSNGSEFITPFLENDFFVFNSQFYDEHFTKNDIYSIYNHCLENLNIIDYLSNHFITNGHNINDLFFITNHFFPLFLDNGFVIEPSLYKLDNFINIIKQVILENQTKIIILYFTNQFNNFFQTILNIFLKTKNIIVIDRNASFSFIEKKIQTILMRKDIKISLLQRDESDMKDKIIETYL